MKERKFTFKRRFPGRRRRGILANETHQVGQLASVLSHPQSPLCVLGRLGRGENETRVGRWVGEREEFNDCFVFIGTSFFTVITAPSSVVKFTEFPLKDIVAQLMM